MMIEPFHEISCEQLELIKNSTLFVFALDAEAAGEFDHVTKLIAGVGKINAAYELTKAIQHHKPNCNSQSGIRRKQCF